MKVAIITGASSGIGQSAVIEIARPGNRSHSDLRQQRPGGLETAAAIEKDGGTAVSAPPLLDVGETGAFPAFRRSVVDVLRDTWRRRHVRLPGQQRRLRTHVTDRGYDRGEVPPQADVVLLPQGPVLPDATPAAADGDLAIVNTSSNSAMRSGLEPGTRPTRR